MSYYIKIKTYTDDGLIESTHVIEDLITSSLKTTEDISIAIGKLCQILNLDADLIVDIAGVANVESSELL